MSVDVVSMCMTDCFDRTFRSSVENASGLCCGDLMKNLILRDIMFR